MTHTPGPWFWEKTRYRGKCKGWRLVTAKNGHCTVMDFARSGMRDGQPRFRYRGDKPFGGIMIDADGIDNLNEHPDARLMRTAPDLLKACEMAFNALRSYQYGNGSPALAEEIANYLEAEILKAKGEQP